MLAAAGMLAACGGTTPVAALTAATLSAASTTVAASGSTMLSWSSTDATSCSASGGWSGTLATSGSKSTGPLSSDTSFTLTCTGPGGTSQPASVKILVSTAAPTVTLAANPASVTAGGTSTLSWTSTNATSCSASGAWSGAQATSGTESTGTLAATSSYSLTCSGTTGESASATAVVTVTAAPVPPVPTVTLSAAPTALATGAASTLTWSSTNATSCTASGGWSGALATSGSRSTGPLSTTTTFSLTCTGAGGPSAPAATSVTVVPLPTVVLSAAPTALAAGAASTLTWSSTNATACTASGNWSGTLTASGSKSTGPLTTNSSYSLTCTGVGGTSPPSTATVTIVPVPTATLSVFPTVIAPGGASTLSWSSTNATACTASGGWSGTLGATGSKSTGATNATTSYSLTCSGPGGTSALASATLTVSTVSMSISPTTAAITLTSSQQFTATVPGGGAVTWSVDGVANGNATVGTISSTGLYTAGNAGAHTVTATSVANPTQSATATVAVTDLAGVYTYHNDLSRDGVNSQEYALTTASVSSSFGKLAACGVDGAIYAQPLWVANLQLNGAKHNVVFVATQHDSLYAFDADSTACTVLWNVSLIDTAHGGTSGETSVPSYAMPNGFGDVQPEIGVTGTPVIDPATGNLYVVTKSLNAAQTFFQRLHAIDITSGNERPGSPIAVAAVVPGTGDGGSTVTFNPEFENQRAGLAFANNTVYIAWASHQDLKPWYGWVMGYQYGGGLSQTAAFNTEPNTQQGGVWMAGGAPAVDSNGKLYLSTGNGVFDAGSTTTPPNNDYGDSLLQLSPSLAVEQFFTPSDQEVLYKGDEDFASGGAALLADLPAGNTVTHALVCGGKDAHLFVLNRDMLGVGDGFAVQEVNFGVNSAGKPEGFFSTPALWNGYLYVSPQSAALQAFQLTPSTVQFNFSSASPEVYPSHGATPSVSAQGTQNGIVWALDNSNYCTQSSLGCGPAVLHAYDATDLATELWNSATNPADSAGYAVKFTVPTIANGRVYVGTRGNNTGGVDDTTSTPGELDFYGLKP